MFTIVTQYNESRPVSAYQVEDIDSAIHIARTTAQYDNVIQTTVFVPNERDSNGIGSMTHVATFGHYAPWAEASV